MRLASRSRYGLRAMFDIAFHSRGAATQVKDISGRQGIPPRFLEQIFQDLKRAGLVTSKRGPRGGYQLAGQPSEVSLGDILRALAGSVDLTSNTAETPLTDRAASCALMEDALAQLSARFQACFDEITLEDLCERGRSRASVASSWAATSTVFEPSPNPIPRRTQHGRNRTYPHPTTHSHRRTG